MVLWNFSRNLLHKRVPVAFVKVYRKYEFLCVVILYFIISVLSDERFHETVIILENGRF